MKSHHCDQTLDPKGTWQQSWLALERAYAEGRASSIGVSNFPLALLKELQGFAHVLPHVVQNFAEPGQLGLPEREWCTQFEAVFAPYSVQRNLPFLAAPLLASISSAAAAHGVSLNAVVLKFFLQSGNSAVGCSVFVSSHRLSPALTFTNSQALQSSLTPRSQHT